MMGSMKNMLISSPPNSNYNLNSSSNVELEESEIWNNNGYSSSNDVVVDRFERMMRVSCNRTKSSSSSKAISIPTTTTATTGMKKLPSRSSSWNKSKTAPSSSVSMSLPVNIPDWSKIMGGGKGKAQLDHQQQLYGYNNWGMNSNNNNDDYDDEDEDADEDWVPPHEYTARQMTRRSGMAVAFSVHEGVGRTLKGRDLSRVRNAIWKQTGFED